MTTVQTTAATRTGIVAEARTATRGTGSGFDAVLAGALRDDRGADPLAARRSADRGSGVAERSAASPVPSWVRFHPLSVWS
ncbi:hypothetical protein, partial [Cellulomonas denverensis]